MTAEQHDSIVRESIPGLCHLEHLIAMLALPQSLRQRAALLCMLPVL
jgi:hypothetical protein